MRGAGTSLTGDQAGLHHNVHPNMFWETAHEELRVLVHRDVLGVREDCLEAIHEMLDRGVEQQMPQLGQPRAIDGQAKAKAA